MSSPENQVPPKSQELGISIFGVHSHEDLEQIVQSLHERSVPYWLVVDDDAEEKGHYTLTLPNGAFEHDTKPDYPNNGQERLFIYAKARIEGGKVSPELLSIGGLLREGLVQRVEGQNDCTFWENPNFSDIETSEAA